MWLAGQPRFEYPFSEERRGGTEDLPEDNLVRELVAVSRVDAALGPELTAATTMREVMEVIKPRGKWAVRWYEDGFDEGRAQLVRRLVARRFGADIADRMVPALDDFADPERIESVADAMLDCETAEEFLARTADS